MNWFKEPTALSAQQDGIDHQFDIIYREGRDLRHFLTNFSPGCLGSWRAYKFLSIDGTRIGWSSESLAKLLFSLVAVHDEYSTIFKVKSFYPLRLVFSYDDIRERICVYGGAMHLNPASTPLQWLDTSLEVTDHCLESVQRNQTSLLKNIKLVQDTLGIRIRKGYSCSSKEYFHLLDTLASSLCLHIDSPKVLFQITHDTSKSFTALTLHDGKPIQIVTESHYACPGGAYTNRYKFHHSKIAIVLYRPVPRGAREILKGEWNANQNP